MTRAELIRDRHMKSKHLIAVLICSVLSAAFAGTAPSSRPAAPQVGVVQCPDRSLRVLYGIPLNLFFGPVVGASDGRAAFANDIGLLADVRGITLISTGGSLLGSLESNTFGAVLGVAPVPSVATGAAVPLLGRVAAWLPVLSSIATWNGAGFTVVKVDPFSGMVRAVAPLTNSAVALLISLPGGGVARNVVSLQNGQVLSSTIPDSSALSMYERAGFILSLDAQKLTVSDPAGHNQMFPIPAPNIDIDSIADRALVLRSGRANSGWVLQLDDAALVRGALRLSVLPGAPLPKPASLSGKAGTPLGPRGVQ